MEGRPKFPSPEGRGKRAMDLDAYFTSPFTYSSMLV
jgi:hypothetical protein